MLYRIPKLALTTGPPGSGKSTIASYLGERGFAVVDVDKITKKLLGHPWPFRPVDNVDALWPAIIQERDIALYGGNVVIDMVATDDTQRDYALWTPVSAEKYLIHVKADPVIIKQRRQARADRGEEGWTKDTLDLFEKRETFSEPAQRPGYTLLAYENNTPQDMERIKADLRRKLGI